MSSWCSSCGPPIWTILPSIPNLAIQRKSFASLKHKLQPWDSKYGLCGSKVAASHTSLRVGPTTHMMNNVDQPMFRLSLCRVWFCGGTLAVLGWGPSIQSESLKCKLLPKLRFLVGFYQWDGQLISFSERSFFVWRAPGVFRVSESRFNFRMKALPNGPTKPGASLPLNTLMCGFDLISAQSPQPGLWLIFLHRMS